MVYLTVCVALTYMRYFAAQQGGDVGEHDDGAPDDEGNRRSQVERGGPQGEPGVVLEARHVVDAQGVGREAQDGDAAEQGERRDAYPGSVRHFEDLDLFSEVFIVGLNLEVGRGDLVLD